MLSELRIQNLAVVEDAVIPFAPGLNVLTGSTGAGKSIILSAVDLLSGSRGRRSLMRRGAKILTVEGIFTVHEEWQFRETLGMTAADEYVSIKRELTDKGKSRLWINGMLTTLTAAADTARSLLELHGQRRQQELLDPSGHVFYLDARGDYGDLLDRCIETIERYARLAGRLRQLNAEFEEHNKQEEYLQFQQRELEALNLEPGLDRKLETRVKLLGSRHRYISELEESLRDLSGENGSVLDKLAGAEKALASLSEIDAKWKEPASEIRDIRISVQEIVRELERTRGEVEDGPENLEVLQERLAAIQRLSRKHGLDCNGLIERKAEIEAILRSLKDGSDELIETERELGMVRGKLVPLLEKLSAERKRTARTLDGEMVMELRKLGMKGAEFETVVERLEDCAFQCADDEIHLNARGRDRIEFMIRTNVGENMHPLAEVASGGELSRITLVLKKLQAEERKIPTLIFDEIDSGLGADLGSVVAERLNELAGAYQIICITHLPQVAARAAQHIVVRKRVREGRTVTSAAALDREERIAELSRMLGGKGKLREELAAELLKMGKRARSSAG